VSSIDTRTLLLRQQLVWARLVPAHLIDDLDASARGVRQRMAMDGWEMERSWALALSLGYVNVKNAVAVGALDKDRFHALHELAWNLNLSREKSNTARMGDMLWFWIYSFQISMFWQYRCHTGLKWIIKSKQPCIIFVDLILYRFSTMKLACQNIFEWHLEYKFISFCKNMFKMFDLLSLPSPSSETNYGAATIFSPQLGPQIFMVQTLTVTRATGLKQCKFYI